MLTFNSIVNKLYKEIAFLIIFMFRQANQVMVIQINYLSYIFCYFKNKVIFEKLKNIKILENIKFQQLIKIHQMNIIYAWIVTIQAIEETINLIIFFVIVELISYQKHFEM